VVVVGDGEFEIEHFGAGTTISTVQRVLRSRGQTLAGTPSISTATLGGWIFSGSHGSGGELWTPTVKSITVYDQSSGRTLRDVPKRLCFGDDRTIDEQRKYMILSVRVSPVDDVLVQRSAFDVVDISSARRFMSKDTHLRMIFVDSSQALAFTWTRTTGLSSETGPSLCPPWLAVILPSFASRRLPRSSFCRVQRLSSANDFAPTPPLLGDAFAFLFVNFELFIRRTLSADTLILLVRELRELFSCGEAVGRCEVRYGKGKLFLDFALRRRLLHTLERDIARVVERVRRVFGVDVSISVHKGKYQCSIDPL
jgi:hypothetical protein